MENIDRAGKCPIWETSAEIKDHPEKQSVVIVDSPRAGGKYCLSNLLPELDDKTKARITSWLIKQRSLGVECPKVDAKTINEERSSGRALKINERANRLLELMELKSPVMGYLLNFYTENSNPDYYTTYEEMLAWSESIDVSEVRSLLSYLQESGWIKTTNNTSGGTAIITAAGYAHLEEMLLEKTITDSSTDFSKNLSSQPLKQYQVALSFAGKQRSYVREVAQSLQSSGISVFYDEFERINSWGKSLIEYLDEVLSQDSKYVVMFISQEYKDKMWPSYERQLCLNRMLKESREFILPVRFDNVSLPGLPDDISYIEPPSEPVELAAIICEKLGIKKFESKASNVPPPRMTSMTGEAVFDYSNYNHRYLLGSGVLEFETYWSKASNTSIHICNDPPTINGIALAPGCNSITQVANAKALNYTSRCRTPKLGQIVVLRNTNGFYAALHVLDIKDDSRGDDRDELRFRYVVLSDGSDDFTVLDGQID